MSLFWLDHRGLALQMSEWVSDWLDWSAQCWRFLSGWCAFKMNRQEHELRRYVHYEYRRHPLKLQLVLQLDSANLRISRRRRRSSVPFRRRYTVWSFEWDWLGLKSLTESGGDVKASSRKESLPAVAWRYRDAPQRNTVGEKKLDMLATAHLMLEHLIVGLHCPKQATNSPQVAYLRPCKPSQKLSLQVRNTASDWSTDSTQGIMGLLMDG